MSGVYQVHCFGMAGFLGEMFFDHWPTPIELLQGTVRADIAVPDSFPKQTAATADQAAINRTEMETLIQPKITGYRQLNEADAALMNEVKAAGLAIEKLCQKVDKHIANQRTLADEDEEARLNTAEPERWSRWGRDGMQANLMYLTRAIAQPSTF